MSEGVYSLDQKHQGGCRGRALQGGPFSTDHRSQMRKGLQSRRPTINQIRKGLQSRRLTARLGGCRGKYGITSFLLSCATSIKKAMLDTTPSSACPSLTAQVRHPMPTFKVPSFHSSHDVAVHTPFNALHDGAGGVQPPAQPPAQPPHVWCSPLSPVAPCCYTGELITGSDNWWCADSREALHGKVDAWEMENTCFSELTTGALFGGHGARGARCDARE
eukprot:scaffold181869_cov20-Tisochrysis_lutea.AAC.1